MEAVTKGPWDSLQNELNDIGSQRRLQDARPGASGHGVTRRVLTTPMRVLLVVPYTVTMDATTTVPPLAALDLVNRSVAGTDSLASQKLPFLVGAFIPVRLFQHPHIRAGSLGMVLGKHGLACVTYA